MSELPNNAVSPLDQALQGLRSGKLVIVVDAQERENEGDLICAAESVTPEMVNFMLRQGAGVLCAPMAHDIADRLRLRPMVEPESNTSPHQTPFLVSIDHRNSGTGVSTAARALTLQALADPQAIASDFVQPGHIAPLLAKEGGVLRRAGHTEAVIDLLKMAGLRPVGCLIEILSQRGDGMADADELRIMSEKYAIPIISIAEIIQHRRLREQLVHRDVEVEIPTRDYGTPRLIGYRVEHEQQEPLAIVWGDLTSVPAPLVRMHSSCFTGDILGSLRCDCGDQFQMAAEMIHQTGVGAIIYLPQEGRGIGLAAKLRAYKLQDEGLDTVEANHRLGFKADERDYMVGLQILKDLGLRDVRLLTNNVRKREAIDMFEQWVGLRVREQVKLVAPYQKERERYLQTKREKLGHLLPELFAPPEPKT